LKSITNFQAFAKVSKPKPSIHEELIPVKVAGESTDVGIFMANMSPGTK
jgi:hypothetical protein